MSVIPIEAAAAQAIDKPTYVPAPRLANVERCRILAMLEIVCFHDTHGRIPLIAGLGLPTFLLLTNVFNCTLTEKRGFMNFVRDKFDRLALPWLFWSAIYGALLVSGAVKRNIPLTEVFTPLMVLTGTYAHLWFVPFALFSGIFVASTQYATKQRNTWAVIGAACLGGAVLVLTASHFAGREWPAPAPQWLFSLPSSFMGFAIGRALLSKDSEVLKKTLLAISIVSVVAWVATLLIQSDFTILRYSVSLLLVAAALTWPGKSDALSKYIAPLLFGIYLVHPLVEKVLVKLPVIGHSQFLFLLDFVVTGFVVYGLKRTPLRRFV